MWEVIQYVTSGLTLVAFLVAAVAWVYKSKSEERERLIKSAPEDKRADLIRLAFEFVDVDTSGLTKEQKYQLALVQIQLRGQRFRTTAIAVCVLAVTLASVSAFAIWKQRAAENPSKEEPTSNRNAKLVHIYTLRVEGSNEANQEFLWAIRALPGVEAQSRFVGSQNTNVSEIAIFSQGPQDESNVRVIASKYGTKVLTYGLSNPPSYER